MTRKPRIQESGHDVASPPSLDGLVRAFKGLRKADRIRFMRGIADEVPSKLWFELQNTSVQRLDYPHAEIHLHVTSSAENIRTRACAKEPFTVEWIESRICADDVLYDIGANVGVYSLVAAKKASGSARVFAFEPSYANLAALCGNIVLNNAAPAVTPVPVALSDSTSLATFSLRTLEPGAARHMLGEGESAEGPTVYSQPVMTYRLDDLIGDFGLPLPNHIKLDVDGGELEVLAGAEKALRSPTLRSLLIEVSTAMSDQVAQMLQGFGLQLETKVNVQNKAGEYRVWYGVFTPAVRNGTACVSQRFLSR